MDPQPKTIPIRADATASHPAAAKGCSDCLHSPGGPVCRSAPPAPRGPAVISGASDEVARLLAALQPVLGKGGEGLLQGLQVQPGEVTLTLAVGRACGGHELAVAAFDTLRQLLPDTDIYVMHAG